MKEYVLAKPIRNERAKKNATPSPRYPIITTDILRAGQNPTFLLQDPAIDSGQQVSIRPISEQTFCCLLLRVRHREGYIPGARSWQLQTGQPLCNDMLRLLLTPRCLRLVH